MQRISKVGNEFFHITHYVHSRYLKNFESEGVSSRIIHPNKNDIDVFFREAQGSGLIEV